MSGRKNDEGKLRTDLIPSEPIEALATILTHGAGKYAPNNWQKGISFRRVYAAMLRHLLAYRRGKFQDQESGHPHLDHAFCNLMFLIYYNHPNHYKRYEEFNDFVDEWQQKYYKKLNKTIDELKQETIPEVEKMCINCLHGEIMTSICTYCDKDYSEWEQKLSQQETASVEKSCDICVYRDISPSSPPCSNNCFGTEPHHNWWYYNWESKETTSEIKKNCSTCRFLFSDVHIDPCKACLAANEYRGWEFKNE